MLRQSALGLLTAAALAMTSAGPSVADDVLSGTVRIESTSIALGIGVTWGDGILTYEGKEYHFSVSGLSVVDLGVASVTATGEVYNLTSIDQFEGNYAAGEAGAVLGGGASIAELRNQSGVVIKLDSTQSGAKLTLAAEGVNIDLK
jgi:hypothetical protein